MKSVMIACAAAAVALGAGAVEKTMPVSHPANPMYLKGICERPWWDRAWSDRLPIVVSEMSTNKVANFVVEAEIDLGKAVRPESLRVVTAYETEVPCWAESAGGTKVRLFFRTDLRAAENRPFLVYFGNDAAPRAAVDDEVRLRKTDDDYTLVNGALTFDFPRKSNMRSPISRMKINASFSPNELCRIRGGSAGAALCPSGGAYRDALASNVVTVVCDNPFKKTIRVANQYTTGDYTLYAGGERLEYAICPVNPAQPVAELLTSLSPGGGCAFDDFVYPSLLGTLRRFHAYLDYRSDNNSDYFNFPEFGHWLSEGWFGSRDRDRGTTVGLFYNPSDLESIREGVWVEARAQWMFMRMKDAGKGAAQEVRGALFGTGGDGYVIQRAWRAWANPPQVLVGVPEARREIPVKRVNMRTDLCLDFNYNSMPRSQEGVERLPHAYADWAKRLVDRVRARGANAVRLTSGNQLDELPLSAETIRLLQAKDPQRFGKETVETFAKRAAVTKAVVDEYHRQGMPVYSWGVGGYRWKDSNVWMPEWREIETSIAKDFARAGFDAVWCNVLNLEGPRLHPDDQGKLGWKFDYWNWPEENREHHFRSVDSTLDFVRGLRAEIHKVNPDANLLIWGCDLGPVNNEMYTIDLAGDCDIVQQEMMDLNRMVYERTKYGIARMRAMFDNVRRTVYNHFWARRGGDLWRVGNCDMAFAFGANGFTQENEDYGDVDEEIVETTGDFYRFARGTGIGRFTERMTPVRFFTAFRDGRASREDLRRKRLGRETPCGDLMCDNDQRTFTHTDGQASLWATAKNISLDLTLNRFFTLESLRRYKVLLVPHDRQFTGKELEVLKAYVREGGVAYADGAEFPFAGFFADGAKPLAGLEALKVVTRPLGKGHLVYSPEELSLRRATMADGSPLRAALAKLAGAPEPIEMETRFRGLVDGQLRTDGTCWMYSTYSNLMPGKTGDVVRVRLNVPVKPGLFALDFKTGARRPFDGTIEFFQEHLGCAYVLIGPDAETRVPAHTVCRAPFGPVTPVGMLEQAAKNLAERRQLGDFTRPKRILIYDKPRDWFDENSIKPVLVCREFAMDEVTFSPAREILAKMMVRGETVDEWLKRYPHVNVYEGEAFRRELAKSDILMVRVPPEAQKDLFTACADDLRAFLGRGGAILFDQEDTAPETRAFLKSAGVDDPNADGRRISHPEILGWGSGRYALPTDHLINTISGPLFRPWRGSGIQFEHCFETWNRQTQIAPFVANVNTNWAVCVIQENVLGKGRVCFQENQRAFTDWYEFRGYSENLISYLIGLGLNRHLRLVLLLNGGPGEDVTCAVER